MVESAVKEKDSYKPFIIWSVVIFGVWLSFWIITYFAFKDFSKKDVPHLNVGTFGDMFGAINALFSGIALAGIIYAIWLQKKELKLQREELHLTRNELSQTKEEFKIQNETLRLQRFENTFFQLLNLHHEIVDKFFFESTAKSNSTTYFKREVLSILKDLLMYYIRFNSNIEQRDENGFSITSHNPSHKIESIEEAFSKIEKGYHHFFAVKKSDRILSHYYQNLYHIFKYIYLSDLIKIEEKKFYAGIVRSQLSPDELLLIYYNSMVSDLGNPKFLFLVKEFDLMQNFSRDSISDLEFHEDVFQKLISEVKNPFRKKNPKPASVH